MTENSEDKKMSNAFAALDEMAPAREKTASTNQLKMLVRCFILVQLIFFGVSALDLFYCRWRGAACRDESRFFGDTAASVTASIAALLVKIPAD